jgi:nitroreductase
MTKFSTNKPDRYPTKQVNGQPIKSLAQVLLDRRATQHFKPDPVPDEYLQAILRFGGQAPSGYNLQPWRFIVVRHPENRQRLHEAAYKQPKINEAPVVLIAFAIKGQWRTRMDAFTTMMLVAEAYGLDTAPMEGFDPEAVKKEFGLPEGAEVVALLAIGYASEPDRPYPGRLPLDEFVFEEHYSQNTVQ